MGRVELEGVQRNEAEAGRVLKHQGRVFSDERYDCFEW
jgi:hypothetical protein